MNGLLLIVPFFLVRMVLLFLLNKSAIYRAAYFAPLVKEERKAYYIYQLSNAALFIYLALLNITLDKSLICYLGSLFYILGLILCAITVINFSSPNDRGLNTNGIYRLSRNPMYVSYFICFIGMALLTRSFILMLIVIIFQISAHWIILSEERWCLEKFGTEYKHYMRRVKRYL